MASYTFPDQDYANPHISPAFLPLRNFPATTFITCSHDRLHGQAAKMAQESKEAGVDCELKMLEGVGHHWMPS